MKTLALQLQGYLDHLTIERGVAANTLSSYRRDLRRYSKHLEERGITDLAKVGEHDVSEFLVALRRGDPDSGTAALSAVSGTVDDIDAEPGRITVILALHDLINGGHVGHYGTGHGAMSVTVSQ